MVCKNLAAGHWGIALERNKACFIRVNSMIFYRELNLVYAVNTHRNRLALASKVPGQLFLSLDNILEHRVVNCFTCNHKGNHIRTNILKFRVNSYNAVAVIIVSVIAHELHIVNSFSAFVQLNLACNTICRPEVRAVCIVQFNFYNAFVFRLAHIRLFIKLGLCAREDVFKNIVSIFFSNCFKKEFFVTFDFRHFCFL